MTPFGGMLKELGEQRRICRAQLVWEMEKQLSAANVLFFAIQKLFETNTSRKKFNKRPILCCASVEKQRCTQSPCITSVFLQNELCLLQTLFPIAVLCSVGMGPVTCVCNTASRIHKI